MERTKILLEERDMPQCWYNILADLPVPLPPPLHPATRKPVGPQDLAPIFPMGLIEQEMSTERFIRIPDEVMDIYRLWRPTPLYRARKLETALDTPARIYYKYEGTSPVGSHKLSTAIAQAYYNKKEGVKRLATETGAGQWGMALALACNYFGLGCTVYMVKCSYHQKPYRKTAMNLWGATAYPSPSDRTEAGRTILKQYPDTPGSLGIAISEAIEDAVTSGGEAKYALGSVLNHVLLHQTVIGEEAKKQFALVGDYPDVVIGCCGGGSNFAGISFPFIADKAAGKKTRIIGVEPAACPTLTKGKYMYDFGDVAKMTPLLKMYTLGHDFIPAGIHAGGLRYHGMSTIVSLLYDRKIIEAVSYTQKPVFEAAALFARAEAIIPAPESSHAIRCAIDEALKAKAAGEEKTILFNLSGHGYLDMAAYESYLGGKLDDYELSQKDIDDAIARIPKVE
ncbi:MAG TPA: TrpB-like pyridoxal phosphate-dependent enzyme [bacterium]|nr:TrpB-like pyridoxal phosphate-dependent enzyme [bacterium]